MSHFVRRCICGIVLAQCRCIGPKSETIVSPCTHKKPLATDAVTSSLKDNTLTIDTLMDVYLEFCDTEGLPKTIKCSPKFYDVLSKWFYDYEVNIAQEIGSLRTNKYAPLFGIPVYIDFKKKDYEWEFTKE